MNLKFRETSRADDDELQSLHLGAFGEEEGPTIQKLVHALLDRSFSKQVLSLVCESEEMILAHVIFSEVDCPDFEGKIFILAPLGVLPDHQNEGHGSQLVRTGLERLKEKGGSTCFVYGDPSYYSRFGFMPADPEVWIPPQKLQFPHGWQILGRELPSKKESPKQLSCVSPLNQKELW